MLKALIAFAKSRRVGRPTFESVFDIDDLLFLIGLLAIFYLGEKIKFNELVIFPIIEGRIKVTMQLS
jgi:hypothetical protein